MLLVASTPWKASTISLFVTHSKTDVYWEGKLVYINKLHVDKYCPMSVFLKYIEAANIDLYSDLPLFSNMVPYSMHSHFNC